MSEDSTAQTTAPQPAAGCLLRLFWMAGGNVALLFAAIKVAESTQVGIADAAYLAAVIALLAARYFDVTKLHGMTAKAEPATRAHLRRYSIGLVALATVLWLVARASSAAGR